MFQNKRQKHSFIQHNKKINLPSPKNIPSICKSKFIPFTLRQSIVELGKSFENNIFESSISKNDMKFDKVNVPRVTQSITNLDVMSINIPNHPFEQSDGFETNKTGHDFQESQNETFRDSESWKKINSTKKIRNKIIESKSKLKKIVDDSAYMSEYRSNAVRSNRIKAKTCPSTTKNRRNSLDLLNMIINDRHNRKVQKRVWALLTNYMVKKRDNYLKYVELRSQTSKYDSEIINDIDRTPIADQKYTAKIKIALIDLLNKYAIFNPKVGYVQGMNYIIANLYIYFKSKQDTFWVLHSLMSEYHLEELYNTGLDRLKNLFEILDQNVKHHLPECHRHFEANNVTSELYATQYIMT